MPKKPPQIKKVPSKMPKKYRKRNLGIPLPLKSFKLGVGLTDAEGSPPPPPAPSGPPIQSPLSRAGYFSSASPVSDSYSVSHQHSSPASSVGPHGGPHAANLYAVYDSYYAKRYDDRAPAAARYSGFTGHGYSGYPAYAGYSTPSYGGYSPYSELASYYTASRYSDNLRQSPGMYPTSEGLRRPPPRDAAAEMERVYASAGSSNSFGRPLTELTASSSSSGLIRSSRAKSRPTEPEGFSGAYHLRYASPSVNNSTKVSSGQARANYIYGHIPTYMPGYGPASGSGVQQQQQQHLVSDVPQPPHAAPPGYDSRDREVSGRIRRYQAPPAPAPHQS